MDAGESWVYGTGCGSTGCAPRPRFLGLTPTPLRLAQGHRGAEHPEAMRLKRGWKREGRGSGGSAGSGSRVISLGPAAQGTREPPGTPPAGTKATAAATSPGQRHPPGTNRELAALPPPQRGKRDVPRAWKRFGEEQAPPHRRPRDHCGFCFQATLAFLKPDKQEKELLFGARRTN